MGDIILYITGNDWKHVYRGPMYTRTVQNNIVSSLILSYILVSKHNCKYAPEEEKVRKRKSKELWWKHTEE